MLCQREPETNMNNWMPKVWSRRGDHSSARQPSFSGEDRPVSLARASWQQGKCHLAFELDTTIWNRPFTGHKMHDCSLAARQTQRWESHIAVKEAPLGRRECYILHVWDHVLLHMFGILLGILGGGFQPWRPLPPSILLANCQKHTEQYLRHSHCNNDHK